MSKSKAAKPIIKRQFAIRFSHDTEVSAVAATIDIVNQHLATLPGNGYIEPFPEIEMEGFTSLEAYHLYADVTCWEAFNNRTTSFMPSVEQFLKSHYHVEHVTVG